MIFQKPLGWLQRFLYNVELGDLPPIRSTISIDQDWPLEYKKISAGVTTIAGNVFTNLYTASQEKHALVWMLWANNGVLLPVTDSMSLFLVLREGEESPLWNWFGTLVPLTSVPIIGGKTIPAVGGQFSGITPVYVPAGAVLRHIHASVAGGVTYTLSGIMVERLKSYPLRLPA